MSTIRLRFASLFLAWLCVQAEEQLHHAGQGEQFVRAYVQRTAETQSAVMGSSVHQPLRDRRDDEPLKDDGHQEPPEIITTGSDLPPGGVRSNWAQFEAATRRQYEDAIFAMQHPLRGNLLLLTP